MIKIISNLINALSSVILSIVIANYGASEFYSFLQKEVIRKVKIGLPSLSSMTNELTCQKFDKNMNLVPYTRGSCSKKEVKRVRK